MEKIVELLKKHKCLSFSENRTPDGKIVQIHAYLEAPAKVSIHRLETRWKKTTPLSKEFYTKQFWKIKETKNPFSRRFWKTAKRELTESEEEAQGPIKIHAQVVKTYEIAKKTLEKMQEIKNGNSVEVGVSMADGESEPFPPFYQPAIVILQAKNKEGKKILKRLKNALHNAEIIELTRKKQVEQAVLDATGKKIKAYDTPANALETPFDPRWN